MTKAAKIMIISLAVLGSAGFLIFNKLNAQNKAEEAPFGVEEAEAEEPQDRWELVDIGSKMTYGELMVEAGVSRPLAMEIYETALPEYDLAKIREGKHLELKFDAETNILKEFRYKVNSEDFLVVWRDILPEAEPIEETGEVKIDLSALAEGVGSAVETNDDATTDWQAEVRVIEYEVKVKVAEGKIETSLYESAMENNIDERAIIELANAYQWTIDFAMDPRVGDTYKFIYEERYLDGEYVMPGNILAGVYVNDGEQYEVYYFEESEENQGYFDAEGNSVQKMFLKAPVAFKYISSGYSTNPRYVGGQYQRYTSSHMAIDYAAASGTPIRAVGDGTVVGAGWNSQGYGYLTTVRHNGTYTTRYAHQSKIAVSYGQKVKQGQVIGYVGSTGFSTGPHLHYEMIKNGAKTNPLNEILPPGEPLKKESMDSFTAKRDKYRQLMGI